MHNFYHNLNIIPNPTKIDKVQIGDKLMICEVVTCKHFES